MVAENGAQVAGQIYGADESAVQFALLQLANRSFQRSDAGTLFAGDREARSADAEFAGDPAGHYASQCAHGAVGA